MRGETFYRLKKGTESFFRHFFLQNPAQLPSNCWLVPKGLIKVNFFPKELRGRRLFFENIRGQKVIFEKMIRGQRPFSEKSGGRRIFTKNTTRSFLQKKPFGRVKSQMTRVYLIGQNFSGQNFRHQVEISAVLSDEIFSSVSYFPIQFTRKICLNMKIV